MAAEPSCVTPFGGQSIYGVAVSGRSYDATFLDMAFADLPLVQQLPTFTTLVEASEALQAIVARPEYSRLLARAAPHTSSCTSIVVPFSLAAARNAFEGDTVVVFNGIGVVGPAPTASSHNFELDAHVNYDFAGIALAIFQAVPAGAPMS